MNKTFNEQEFTDLANETLMKLVDHAKSEGHNHTAMGILMTGMLVISEISSAIFDDDTETITITKE